MIGAFLGILSWSRGKTVRNPITHFLVDPCIIFFIVQNFQKMATMRNFLQLYLSSFKLKKSSLEVSYSTILSLSC